MSKKRWISVAVVMVVSLVWWTGFLMQKARFHEDEVYTISSSVDAIWENFLDASDDNVAAGNYVGPRVRTREEFENYVTFHGLNLVQVYINQWKDVHPPLYYFLIHIFAAVMPALTMQVGFIINILSLLILDLLIVKIFQLLGRERAILPAMLLMNLSTIGVNLITYQRMYALMAMFIMLTLYLTVKLWKKNWQVEGKDAAALGLTVLGGFLTQYYYVIYVLPLFVMVAIKMVREKGWKNKNLWWYVGAHVVAAAVGILVYPICFQHILFGYRGVGAMAGNSAGRFAELFGALGVMILIGAVIGVMAVWGIWKLTEKKLREPMWLMVVPMAIYLAMVTVTAPWLDFRYFGPILALSAMCVAWLGAEAVMRWKGHEKIGEGILVGVAAIGAMASTVVFEPVYLYRSYASVIDVAEEYRDETMVYISHYWFNAMQNINEYIIYRESAIVDYEKDLEKLGEILDGRERFVLRIDNWLDIEEVKAELGKDGYEIVEELNGWPNPAYLVERTR